MQPAPLDSEALSAALSGLPAWRLDGDALARSYRFTSFRDALAFMVRAGFEAEEMDHHPEWTNVYSKVAVRLNTHSAGARVTALDVDLAGRLDRISLSMGGTAA